MQARLMAEQRIAAMMNSGEYQIVQMDDFNYGTNVQVNVFGWK
jgi:hypothetical protein